MPIIPTSGPPAPRQHPYTNATNGKKVAELFKLWSERKYKPLALRASALNLNPGTLQQKIIYGLTWLAKNAGAPWDEHKASTEVRRTAEGVELHRVERNIDYTKAVVEAVIDEPLRNELMEWIASDPPTNAAFRRVGLTLAPEDEMFFQTTMAELSEHYKYAITHSNILIIRK